MSVKAFPVNDIIERDDKGHYKGVNVSQTGMDLRDYFAGKALQSLIAIYEPKSPDGCVPDCAEAAYLYADAMMKARG